ncbi:FkbM family methyltransferase [Phyllobacterium myrsinacearum]|uniref:FkbM family methyltransferase n=1 Tax=Phyllobacterium myrsinacearum TaxID=28101 RepID=UPI001028C984|nr:FkbM family methyltransferase [Phyllobacterium myrsinacearum]RZS79644.1 FkbM family methyltransferase [Phyllobacterium myrsinacearum]
MTSYNDIMSCYKFILGREANAEEIKLITDNLLDISDIAFDEHRRRFLSSPEFHYRHADVVFENFVRESVEILYETKNNFKIYLDLRQYYMTFGIFNGQHKKFDLEIIKAITPDDGLFIDVGANVGYYSLSLASKPGFHGKILAFEPLPHLWNLFSKSIAENRLAKTITLHKLALADAPGTMQLNDAEYTINAGATSLVPGSRDTDCTRSTRVETLDAMAKKRKPDSIKVDIEGAEGLFFAGAAATIAASKPVILVEINRELLANLSKSTPGRIFEQLADHGYDMWEVRPGALAPLPTAHAASMAFPAEHVANILAVHPDRKPDIARRLQALDLTL